MKISSATSAGRVRPVNEDAFFVSPDVNGAVLAIVADGMGGHNAGEIASNETIKVMKNVVLEEDKSPKELLTEAVNSANRTVFDMSIDTPSMSGMGTTVTACVIENDKVTAAQVGDSRLYLIRDGLIIQITKDHSLVEMLVENGSITKEEAKHHPKKNVITRAIGTDKTVSADLYEFTVNSEDILLLCSDGLVNMVEDEKILSVITGTDAFEETADRLVQEAENAGGDDNITVILIKF